MRGCLRSFPAAGDRTVTPLDLTAAEGRRLILDLQGLADPPHRRFEGDGLLGLIARMGFVQVDSIRTVARAPPHHPAQPEPDLPAGHAGPPARTRPQPVRALDPRRLGHPDGLLSGMAPQVPARGGNPAGEIPALARPGIRGGDRAVARPDRRTGAGAGARSRNPAARNPRGWWDWHAGKTALEFLWRTGELAITRRENFQKVYDLSPRVLPPPAFDDGPDEAGFIDWACRSALDRLGFGTAGEIAGYWALVTTGEADAWAKARLGTEVIAAKVDAADRDIRPRTFYARADLEACLAATTDPPAGLRVLSPFDPLVRDRKRLRHLFGFDYRIEIFVAEAQRQYGYYIFPLLEGDRTVGRIDMTANRTAGILNVRKLWLEPGIRFGAGRGRCLTARWSVSQGLPIAGKWRMRMIGFRTFDVAGISTGGARPESGHAR